MRKFSDRIRCWFGLACPRTAIVVNYLWKIHRMPHLRHPRSLNEKINWLKLHGDNKAIAHLADKYAVRSYVEKKGLGDILVPLLGKFDDVAALREAWPSLEAPFVIKANNSCQTVIVVKDKAGVNLEAILHTVQAWMDDREFWGFFVEPQYKYIEPCIIVEKFLTETGETAKHSSSLVDYKIWCFDGKPECLWVCTNRGPHGLDTQCFDFDWRQHPERLRFNHHFRKASMPLPRPAGLERMKECAAILSKGFPQVRVDFYCVGGKVYFGEMTFTSNGGFMTYFTPEYLLELGERCGL